MAGGKGRAGAGARWWKTKTKGMGKTEAGGNEYEGHEACRRRRGLLLTEGRDGRERGQTNATLLGQIQSESNGFAARQKRKARCASGGLSFLDRPVIITPRSPRGPVTHASNKVRCQSPVFLENHRRWIQSEPLIERPPSKSGRPPRQVPLRMPYATPFLLTNPSSSMASALPPLSSGRLPASSRPL